MWFIAGSLAQCRIYFKYLGLQIKPSRSDYCREFAVFPDASNGAFGGEYQAESVPHGASMGHRTLTATSMRRSQTRDLIRSVAENR
jgi:hypothetical protein